MRTNSYNNNILWKIVYVFLLLVVFGIATQSNRVHAQTSGTDDNPAKVIPVPSPASDLWRAVRQREGNVQSALTQVKGVDSSILVAESGENFRSLRTSKIIPYLPVVLFGITGLIALFYFIRGQIKVEGGRAGISVVRFRDFERMTHWLVAILFIFLALTGLILLFGRFILLPIFGKEVFSLIASACKESHNLIGPLFLVGVVMLFILFVSRNLPTKGDIKWMLKGGGFGKNHVKAGFFNAGEKIWFWLVILLGLTASISGLILDFPIFGQGRGVMQLSLIIHSIAAVTLISFSFGHIYLATIGTEGTLRGMTTGKVDVNWAKTHHDLWLEELDDSKKITDVDDSPVPDKGDRETSPAHP